MLKINVGCGDMPMLGWTNVDQTAISGVDIVATVPPLPFGDATADEIFASHFLEHLTFDEAHVFLDECQRVLKPGGRLGLIVPDAKQVFLRWIHRINEEVFITDRYYDVTDLDDICTVFLYGGRDGINTESLHKWLWEPYTLSRAMAQHGFTNLALIDRYRDPRLAAPAWFQCGVDGVKV